MFAALVNRLSSNIDISAYANIVRAAATISNQAWVSPFDHFHINHESVLVSSANKLPQKVKLNFIISQLPSWEEEEGQEGFTESFMRLPLILKDLKSIKHPKPSIIKEIKLFESKIDEIYLDFAIRRIDNMKIYGMIQLEPIIACGLFNYFDCNEKNNFTHDDFTYHTMKEIMKLELKQKPMLPLMFFLSGELASDDFVFPKYYAVSDKEAINKNKTWFDNGFDITGLISLSASDFLALNDSIEKEGTAFNEAMNKWIEVTQNDSLNFNDVCYYINEVKSKKDLFSEAIANNIILSPYKEHPYRFYMQIGAMPVRDIWHYFYKANCINEQELTELIEESKDNPAFQGRWPVMSFMVYDRDSGKYFHRHELGNIKAVPNSTKRKVINLD